MSNVHFFLGIRFVFAFDSMLPAKLNLAQKL